MSNPSKAATFTLLSEKLKTNYLIFASAPTLPGLPHLILVMDGDDQFEAAQQAATDLQAGGAVPPLLLIGVGYGGSYRSSKNRRGRDYTPTRSADEPSETGQANEFLEFIVETLLPELRKRYQFVEDDIAITGHSLGSLFGLYALARASASFRRFLVSSPSIWWDDRSILKILEDNRDSAPKMIRAFFCVGSEDSPSMLGDLDILKQRLLANPPKNLAYIFRQFPGKDHYNSLPISFSEGLRWLYALPSGP